MHAFFDDIQSADYVSVVQWPYSGKSLSWIFNTECSDGEMHLAVLFLNISVAAKYKHDYFVLNRLK